jgi:hypothetical protein
MPYLAILFAVCAASELVTWIANKRGSAKASITIAPLPTSDQKQSPDKDVPVIIPPIKEDQNVESTIQAPAK